MRVVVFLLFCCFVVVPTWGRRALTPGDGEVGRPKA